MAYIKKINAGNPAVTYDIKDAEAEVAANKVSSFQATPDNTHYPTEKLVYDTIAAHTGNTGNPHQVTAEQTAYDGTAESHTSGSVAAELKSHADELTAQSADIVALETVMPTKANKTALERTDRSLDALWKLNEGHTYEFDVDSESVYTKTVPSGSLYDTVDMIGGKSERWNQLQRPRNSMPSLPSGITYDNGVFTLNGEIQENSAIGSSNAFLETRLINGHKYILSSSLVDADIVMGINGYGFSEGTLQTKLYTHTWTTYTSGAGIQIRFTQTKTYNNAKLSLCLFDLTDKYGAGNEPSTVAEFKALYPNDYYEYDTGSIKHASVNTVSVQGANLFNSSLTTGTNKYVSAANGLINSPSSGNYRCTDNGYVNVVPNTMYICTYTPYSTASTGLAFYDYDKNFISGLQSSNYAEFTTPNNAYYVRFTWSYDIDGDGSGIIFRQKDPIGSYNIPTAIQQLEGYGWSAGDVYNYVDYATNTYHKRVGAVDLGSLTWTYVSGAANPYFFVNVSSTTLRSATNNLLCALYTAVANGTDAEFEAITTNLVMNTWKNGKGIRIRNTAYTNSEAFKTAMSGVMLYYELATEVTTDISSLIPDGFLENMDVEVGGTITYANTNGDGFRIPVPVTNEFIVKLSEVQT